jgi:hypothetical protein
MASVAVRCEGNESRVWVVLRIKNMGKDSDGAKRESADILVAAAATSKVKCIGTNAAAPKVVAAVST